MNHPARAFQTHHHLVARLRRSQHRRNFFAQAAYLVSIHTAFEIQHPDTRLAAGFRGTQFCPRFGLFGFLLMLFLLRFMPELLLRAIQQRHRQLFFHLLILLAKIRYPQLAALLLTLSQINDNGGDNRNGDDDSRSLG